MNSSKAVVKLQCIPNRSQKSSGMERIRLPLATKNRKPQKLINLRNERLARMDPISQLQEMVLEQSKQIRKQNIVIKELSKRLDELQLEP